MGTNNICFHEEIRKTFTWYSPSYQELCFIIHFLMLHITYYCDVMQLRLKNRIILFTIYGNDLLSSDFIIKQSEQKLKNKDTNIITTKIPMYMKTR